MRYRWSPDRTGRIDLPIPEMRKACRTASAVPEPLGVSWSLGGEDLDQIRVEKLEKR